MLTVTERRLTTYIAQNRADRLTPRQRRRAVHKANRLDPKARAVALAAIAVLVAGCSAGGGHAKTARTATAGPSLMRYTRPWTGWGGLPTATTTTIAVSTPPSRVGRSSRQPTRGRTGPQPRRPASASGDPWGCIRQYESGGTTDPAGSNAPGEGYYGFTDSTWHSVGGTGHASDHSYAEQTARAQQLQQRSGWGQWSTAHRCGLA